MRAKQPLKTGQIGHPNISVINQTFAIQNNMTDPTIALKNTARLTRGAAGKLLLIFLLIEETRHFQTEQ
jgi:hypothetical protein